ncbi:MAG: Uma2 family endonuclease [Coleofasciculaceae cyanobacterium RL_1_1]|nr:Uma2 family endonuclease [Coleofasciculaceae cyanobacterium RL_1_1]
MTVAQDNTPHLTPEEYFAWEEQQLEKYELINGRVYPIGIEAMSSGSKNHSLIAAKLITLFSNHLEESSCETATSDLRIKIVNTDNYTYPDASVTYDDRDKLTTRYITYPCLILEVLSKSTEAYDRGGKFRMYRRNPKLIDYLLVSSTSIEIDLYHKTEAGDWVILNYQAGDTIELQSINLSFAIEQIYRRLTLTPESESA